jgi:hypothetical protein
MERIEKSFEINAPLRTVYNQWTQFEEWPEFMDGIEEVRQIDDTHLHWRASVGGKDKEWTAEITEQVPDQVIAWRSTSGAPNNGQVRFQAIGPDRTRVMLSMEYEPETAVEKAGDALGVLSRRVEKTVEDFKAFIEQRGRETGGWRGEVHGGRETGPGTSDPSPNRSSNMGGGRPGGGTPARDITGSPDPASIRPGSTGIPGESGSAGGSGGSGGLPGDDEDFLRRP